MKDIITFYERANSLLAAQFSETLASGEKSNFQKMIASLVAPCYDLNTVELQLYNERWLATAVGVQLDRLGEILGLPRAPGQSDADYRELLYYQARINSSTGTPEELIAALKFLTSASHVEYFELPSAFFQMYTNGLPENFSVPPDEIVSAIFAMSPAGVQYSPITWYYAEDPVFVFSGDPIVENFYVAPNPADLTEINPFHVSPDGIADDPFAINRGQVDINPEGGGFAESDFVVAGAGSLAEVLYVNGGIAPPL